MSGWPLVFGDITQITPNTDCDASSLYYIMNNDRALLVPGIGVGDVSRWLAPISVSTDVDLSCTNETDWFASFVRYSDDGGRSWQSSSVVSPGSAGPARGFMEPSLVRNETAGDDALTLLMRTRAGVAYRAQSSDGGTSWADAAPFVPAATPALTMPEAPQVCVWGGEN